MIQQLKERVDHVAKVSVELTLALIELNRKMVSAEESAKDFDLLARDLIATAQTIKSLAYDLRKTDRLAVLK